MALRSSPVGSEEPPPSPSPGGAAPPSVDPVPVPPPASVDPGAVPPPPPVDPAAGGGEEHASATADEQSATASSLASVGEALRSRCRRRRTSHGARARRGRIASAPVERPHPQPLAARVAVPLAPLDEVPPVPAAAPPPPGGGGVAPTLSPRTHPPP